MSAVERSRGGDPGVIATLRRRRGLSQKALADRLGLPVWALDALERGERDARPHRRALAEALGRSEEEICPGPPAADPRKPVAHRQRSRPAVASWGLTSVRDAPVGLVVVLGALGVLLVIRFFTEVVEVLPEPVTFVDIPLAGLLALVALARPAGTVSSVRAWPAPFFTGVLFLIVVMVSALVHLERVDPAPALVFLYGFLSPLAVYLAVFRLWPAGHALTLSRFLIAIGVLQILVVAGIQLPLFLAEGNPDEVSGTFGENPYQLIFYLIVFSALLVGVALFEPRRLAARIAPLLLFANALIIFLAQYRALLLTTFLSIVLVAALISVVRVRALIFAPLALAIFIGAFYLVSAKFPENRLNEALNAVQRDPWFFVEARTAPLGDLPDLYADPVQAAVGTGPGTFSSRAWRTFAIIRESRTAVAGPYAQALTGGEYRTDVAERYTIPKLRGPAVEGSFLVTSPLSSYLALLAEAGLLGAFLMLGLYVLALVRSGRLAVNRLRERRADDPLPALLVSATVAFFVLLQIALLENWLEVTRVTFLSWSLLAVASKELAERSR